VALGSIAVLKAAPIVLVMLPTSAICAALYGVCAYKHEKLERSISDKYLQQAEIASAYEQAKKAEPKSERPLDKGLAEDFAAALSRIEEGLQNLKNHLDSDKSPMIDKAKPKK
jgi:hypothetical protein